MKKKELPIGKAVYYMMLLCIGYGYTEVSTKRRNELMNEIINQIDHLGNIKIEQESYDLIKEKLLNK